MMDADSFVRCDAPPARSKFDNKGKCENRRLDDQTDRAEPCEETALLLAALEEAATEGHPIILEHDDGYCGDLVYKLASDWRVTVNMDCGCPNYIDSMTSPDGKVWQFDDLPNTVQYWVTWPMYDKWPQSSERVTHGWATFKAARESAAEEYVERRDALREQHPLSVAKGEPRCVDASTIAD